ncbi:MAG: hypothetical protein ACRDSR_18515 [Pseudonocardiaceae bacterium]
MSLNNSSPGSIRYFFLQRWDKHRGSPEPESGVPEKWHRLFQEQLAELADRLSNKEALSPIPEDQIVQLLAMVAILLRQHHVDKRGRCQSCGLARWKRRPWSRRPPCTVYRAASFVMGQGLDEVWWRLFESVGKEWSLAEVREWLEHRKGE